MKRLLLISLILLLPVMAEAQFHWFRRPVFDCRRIHRGHCCASRIRAACPHICMNVPCGNYQPDGPPPSSRTGGNFPPPPPPQMPPPQPPPPSQPFGFLGIPGFPPLPQPGNIFAGLGIPGLFPPPAPAPSPFGSIGVPPPPSAASPPPPPPTLPSFGGNQGQFGQTPFPTLVPETDTSPPSISSFIDEKGIDAVTEEKTIQVGPNGAVDGIIKAGRETTTGKRKNKGVLKPPAMPGVAPDELVELVDYEGEDYGNTEGRPAPPIPDYETPKRQPPSTAPDYETAVVNGRPPPDPPALPTVTLPPQKPAEERFWTPAAVAVQRVGPIKEEEISIDRTTIPVKEVAGNGLGSWKFAIRPSGYKSEGIEVTPSEKTEEVKAKSDKTINVVEEGNGNSQTFLPPQTQTPTPANGNEFNNKVGELIGNFIANNSLSLGLGRPQQRVSPPPIPTWAQANSTVITPLPSQSPNAPKGVPVLIQTITESPPCGIAPDFRPCVPAEKASTKLLDCCKRRLMPPGCLDLCRYDITQAEIKKAFDAGKCGILHVAPFLECASGGNNNLECCKHRNVAQKSGPQCEVFCNPAGGLGALGLQHLACQSVIGDLLQCHHSGVRPF